MLNKTKYRHSCLISAQLGISVNVLLTLCLFNLPAFAQNVTPNDSVTDDKIEYLSPLEYAFMMHEETSWLMKTNVGTDYRDRSYLNIGFEKRIAPSITLNFALLYSEFEVQRSIHRENGLQGAIEARWYYRLENRIKNGMVARNMSDNYFAIGLGYTHLPHLKNEDFVSVSAKFGIQRRLLKHGHADLGIKANIGLPSKLSDSEFLIFATYVDLGLAFTKDKYILNHEKLCPVLKCYESEKHIFKSNLNNLFFLSLFNDHKILSFEPHIGFEQKIANSPFSVNAAIRLHFIYLEYIFRDEYHYSYYDWYSAYADLQLEGRWYYNLKHRIAAGKTGNGLSANYIAAGGIYSWEENHTYINSGRFTSYHSYYISTGLQRLFSEHLYFDINIGAEYHKSQLRKETSINPKVEIGIGFRF